MEFTLFMLRWLHFLAGITWIGILYYFNFVQTPFFAETEATVRTERFRNSCHALCGGFVGVRCSRFSRVSRSTFCAWARWAGSFLFIVLRRDDHRRWFDRYCDVSQRLARDLAQPADRNRVGQSGRIGRTPSVARCRGGRYVALH